MKTKHSKKLKRELAALEVKLQDLEEQWRKRTHSPIPSTSSTTNLTGGCAKKHLIKHKKKRCKKKERIIMKKKRKHVKKMKEKNIKIQENNKESGSCNSQLQLQTNVGNLAEINNQETQALDVRTDTSNLTEEREQRGEQTGVSAATESEEVLRNRNTDEPNENERMMRTTSEELKTLLGSSGDELVDFEERTDAENWRQTHTTRELKYKFVLHNQRFSDVTFFVGQKLEPVHGHTFPLATASPVFQKMFSVSSQMSRHFNVKIPNYDPKIFRLMLEFLYSGDVAIEDFSVACDLREIARHYVLPQLNEHCLQYLWSHIDIDAMVKVLELNHHFQNSIYGSFYKQSLRHVIIIATNDILRSKILETLNNDSFKSIIDILININLESEANLLDTCIRWCRAEILRRAKGTNPSTLQEVFQPFRERIRFLKLTPEELTLHVIQNDTLPNMDALAILSELLVPNSNSNPLPQYLDKTITKRNIPDDVLQVYVYGIKKINFTATGGLNDGSLQSVYDLISTMKLKVNSGDVLYGVKLTTQILNLEGAYDEKLTVFVNDVESGENVFSVTVKNRLQASSVFEVGFDEGIVFAELPKFAARQEFEIEIKVVPHKSGKYSFINNHGNVRTGQFKGKNDCQLRYPPRHNFIICAVLTKTNYKA